MHGQPVPIRQRQSQRRDGTASTARIFSSRTQTGWENDDISYRCFNLGVLGEKSRPPGFEKGLRVRKRRRSGQGSTRSGARNLVDESQRRFPWQVRASVALLPLAQTSIACIQKPERSTSLARGLDANYPVLVLMKPKPKSEPESASDAPPRPLSPALRQAFRQMVDILSGLVEPPEPPPPPTFH